MHDNVARCLLVARVLFADGTFHEAERAFLEACMKKLGLDEDEKRAVLRLEGWAAAEPIVAALDDRAKRELIVALEDAASVDGHLAKEEIAMIKRIAEQLEVPD